MLIKMWYNQYNEKSHRLILTININLFVEKNMVQCLIDNKICSNTNKRCKICRFDDCKEVLNMTEEVQKYEEKYKLNKLREELPERL